MNRQGFSLLELAVVVVIIALLGAVLLASFSLVRQAEIRTVSRDYTSFRKSFYTFKGKFSALAGDISYATSMWNNTYDGNGNGTYKNGTDFFSEGYHAWQHLALAGMISGSYTGSGGRSNRAKIGINVPASRIDGAGYSLMYDNRMNSFYAPVNKDVIRFGAHHPTWNTGYAVISPQEAYLIDKKLDDGQPDTGRIYGDAGLNKPRHACTNGLNYPDTEYDAGNEEILCMMEFELF